MPSIAELIAAEGGRVTFARFMELALTHPMLGYYSRADRLLRHGGDFSTAPALSPFFNRTLARLVTELVDAWLATCVPGAPATTDPPSVVELGAGEGHLAAAIIDYWKTHRPDLRETICYRIAEVGPRLRQRQADALGEFSREGWRVGWGSDLEEACSGTRPAVIIGNEFLDTLPVDVVDVTADQVREAYVEPAGEGLVQTWGRLSENVRQELVLLLGSSAATDLRDLTDDGVLEVRAGLGSLFRQIATLMPSGSLVNIDYGAWWPGVVTRRVGPMEPGAPGPSPEGPSGMPGASALRRRTVRGYFKHQLIDDPLLRPGRQDLTADVDFAAVDLHGRQRGFQTVLFTTLSAFLRGGNAKSELGALRNGSLAAADALESDRQATVLTNLLDERDLGGSFKLMVQARE